MQIQPKQLTSLAVPNANSSRPKPVTQALVETPSASDQVSLSSLSAPRATLSTPTLTELADKAAITTASQSVAATAGPLVAGAVFEGLKTGFVTDYIDPTATLQQAKALAAKYPDLVDFVELPLRSHGYDGKRTDLQGPAPFYYLRLGPKTDDRDQKMGIFQHAAPHAREHVNPMTMMELAEQLCANYDPNSNDPAVTANTRLMDKLDIFISPQTNPDGANYSFHDDKKWRKNRAPFDGIDTGVDINRNYPYQWTKSPGANYQTYAGQGPASEPETQALIEIVNRHPNIGFVLDWHSHGEDIRRPLGVSQEDNALYDEFHGRMKDAIASSRGREYKPVVSQVVAGSSDDYWYHDRGIISTVVETARSFQPEKDEALSVSQECARGAREALQFAADFADRKALSSESATA